MVKFRKENVMTKKEKEIIKEILSDEDLKQKLYEMLSCIGSMKGSELNESEKEK